MFATTQRPPSTRANVRYSRLLRVQVFRIGNSRGVRLPAASLRRYRIGDSVLMEERSEGILLRPTGPAVEKLSWEATARELATSGEDWTAWDATTAEGLDALPWYGGGPGGSGATPSRHRVERGRGTRR